MNHFKRLFVLVLALAVSGGLGYMFLPDFEPVKMIVFSIVILILGEFFYRIDMHISNKRLSDTNYHK